MAKKDLQQLQLIRERMIASGIPEKEVDDLITPLKDELQRRVCGLVWEHTTTSIPDLEGKIPALVPVAGKNIVNDINGDNHILIEGENLLALMAMQYTHIDENGKGMIDVIYIDPPYNTGSVSFAYNDKFEKSEWLSMMDIRLKLARNLLKDDGVIFISIDDSYLYELKLLCDDILGNDNYLSTICLEISKTQGMKVKAAQEGRIVKNHEYVLIYTKTDAGFLNRVPLYDGTTGYDSHYSYYIDENRNIIPLAQWLEKTQVAQILGSYGLKVSINNLDKMIDILQPLKQFILDHAGVIYREMACNIDIPQSIKDQLENTKAMEWNGYLLHKTATGTVRQYGALSESIHISHDYIPVKTRTTIRGALWKGFYSDMMNVGKEGSVDFKNGKKPLRLIKQLLTWANRPSAVILDFFAGSGTTGHAVLDLNKEDGGHRQFILCTNNELGKDALKMAKKNGYAAGSEEYEDLGVCHAVTYPRMQNIFPDYPGNNLYYYRIDQSITESTIDDVTIANMASQAVFYIAMKENVFNAERCEDYYLLHNAETEIAVITDPDMDMFDVEEDIVPDAFTKTHRKVYCSVYEPCTRNGVEYVPYPKEVLDVLKAAKKYIRREVA